MPTITDQAIVIRRWDFSESSQTVSVLTREHGVVRGLAKGAKREKGDFSGGLDLLTEGQIVAIIKSGRDLATLTAWHLQRVHRSLHEHLAANRSAMFMADLVHHLLIDHDPHVAVFDALSTSLARLDAHPEQFDEALLQLQWCVLCEAGYRPELWRDARTGTVLDQSGRSLQFSSTAGGLIADEDNPAAPAAPTVSDAWRVRQGTIDLLRDLASGQAPASHDRDSLRRANRLLASYAREVIGAEPASWRWAFPDLAR